MVRKQVFTRVTDFPKLIFYLHTLILALTKNSMLKLVISILKLTFAYDAYEELNMLDCPGNGRIDAIQNTCYTCIGSIESMYETEAMLKTCCSSIGSVTRFTEVGFGQGCSEQTCDQVGVENS